MNRISVYTTSFLLVLQPSMGFRGWDGYGKGNGRGRRKEGGEDEVLGNPYKQHHPDPIFTVSYDRSSPE